jgi:site-specific recombinase XerD
MSNTIPNDTDKTTKTNKTDGLTQVLAAYKDWLARQPLSGHTRRAYGVRVGQYLMYLGITPSKYGDPLREPHACDYAVRDYKAFLKTTRKARPTSVNLSLAAIDHFYRFLGLGQPNVRREELPQQAPRALDKEEQKRFLRAVERCPSARDRAIMLLLFYTGLRVGECVNLNVEDVPLSARKGLVIVRAGKGDVYREVPLNAEARNALQTWQEERVRQFPDTKETALCLNRQGHRLSARSVDMLVRKLGQDAALEAGISAHILRHTCLTNLVRNGNDLVLVAEIACHKRLETTRRYSLPSAKDRLAAMEG